MKYFTFARTLVMPADVPPGTYELAMFQCSSKAGSAFTYDTRKMRSFRFPTSLQIYRTEPPPGAGAGPPSPPGPRAPAPPPSVTRPDWTPPSVLLLHSEVKDVDVTKSDGVVPLMLLAVDYVSGNARTRTYVPPKRKFPDFLQNKGKIGGNDP